MPGPLPDSYRRLAMFSSRLLPGTRLYDQGTVPDRFYVVLRGEVIFEVVSEQGDAEVVARADAGSFVGHVAAFTGRPTSASARVERESVVLGIPLLKLADAIREAPELGIQLIYAFAGQPAPAFLSGVEEEGEPQAVAAVDADRDDVVTIEGEIDSQLFFVDTITCPVSSTRFEFLRVRTRAVRPRERESDFHVRYDDVNPTWYGVVVCPGCAFAAYQDDFEPLDEEVRARLWEDREARAAFVEHALTGTRSLEDATTALDLAIRCYEVRGATDSRRAVLQHRRAWLEREAGNAQGDRMWLTRARDSYERAFEADKRLSEEAAARIAYLVGDLSDRLGDLQSAQQWLETATRVAPTASAGIARTARDRLQDVRDLIKRERAAS
ncbi:MAG: DUF2225 domain-containing protein [Dehalococcoidia bacterium]|nr:DUF2225 domain-containing protein [Dehalococcoidia bacterium]